MNALLCISNQWPSEFFQRAIDAATDLDIAERKNDGLDGKAVSREYVRKLVLETVLASSIPAGHA